MKLTLTPKASDILAEIIRHVKEESPLAITSATAVTASIIEDFHANATKRDFSRVAERLVSPKAKRKMLLRDLGKLSERDGAAGLHELEKAVRKLAAVLDDSVENTHENSKI